MKRVLLITASIMVAGLMLASLKLVPVLPVKLEVEAFGGIIRDTQFGAEVELELLFPEAQAGAFLERLTDMTAGTVEGMETGQEYRAFPI